MTIAAQVLGYASALFAAVQFLRKSPLIGNILVKLLGPYGAPILVVLGAALEAFLLYSGDGTLTGGEALQVLSAAIGSVVIHKSLKAGQSKLFPRADAL